MGGILGKLSSGDVIWLILGAVILLGIGLFGGYFFLRQVGAAGVKRARSEASDITAKATSDAQAIVARAELDAEKKLLERKERFEAEVAPKREELREVERRLAKREDLVDRKLEQLSTREEQLARTEKSLTDRLTATTAREAELTATLAEQREKLLTITGLSMEQARAMLLQRVEDEARGDAAKIQRKIIEDRKSVV